VCITKYSFDLFNGVGTGVVAQTVGGQILHGSNYDVLDSTLGPFLNNLIVERAYTRQGEQLYLASGFAGEVGVTRMLATSASSSDHWSFEMNQRLIVSDLSSGTEEFGLETVVQSAKKGNYKSLGLYARTLAEKGVGFEEVVQEIHAHHVLAPVYVIVAGSKKGQGVVLRKGRNTRHEPETIGWLQSPVGGSHTF
jgi:hypothetical protein